MCRTCSTPVSPLVHGMRTFCALMVMPRSRSMSMRSRYCARACRASTTPVSCSMRSASVDLPWSMCAMMQKLRIRAGSVRPADVTPAILTDVSGADGHEGGPSPDLLRERLADRAGAVGEGAGVRTAVVEPHVGPGRLGREPLVPRRDEHPAPLAVPHEPGQVGGLRQPEPEVQPAPRYRLEPRRGGVLAHGVDEDVPPGRQPLAQAADVAAPPRLGGDVERHRLQH